MLPGCAVAASMLRRPMRDQQPLIGKGLAEPIRKIGLGARSWAMRGNLVPVRRQFTVQKRADAMAIGDLLGGPAEFHAKVMQRGDRPAIVYRD